VEAGAPDAALRQVLQLRVADGLVDDGDAAGVLGPERRNGIQRAAVIGAVGGWLDNDGSGQP
jgi:hypothetical protein